LVPVPAGIVYPIKKQWLAKAQDYGMADRKVSLLGDQFVSYGSVSCRWMRD